jgi:hypothetical protein
MPLSNLTRQKDTQIRTYAGRVDLTWRVGIPRQRASPIGAKTDHQVGFTCGNAQQWINQGYVPCTKRMHKNKLPKQPGQF